MSYYISTGIYSNNGMNVTTLLKALEAKIDETNDRLNNVINNPQFIVSGGNPADNKAWSSLYSDSRYARIEDVCWRMTEDGDKYVIEVNPTYNKNNTIVSIPNTRTNTLNVIDSIETSSINVKTNAIFGTANETGEPAKNSIVINNGTIKIGEGGGIEGGSVKNDNLIVNDKLEIGDTETGIVTIEKGSITTSGTITSKTGISTDGTITSKGAITTDTTISSKTGISTDGTITSKGNISTDGTITSKGNISTDESLTVTKNIEVGSITCGDILIGTNDNSSQNISGVDDISCVSIQIGTEPKKITIKDGVIGGLSDVSCTDININSGNDSITLKDGNITASGSITVNNVTTNNKIECKTIQIGSETDHVSIDNNTVSGINSITFNDNNNANQIISKNLQISSGTNNVIINDGGIECNSFNVKDGSNSMVSYNDNELAINGGVTIKLGSNELSINSGIDALESDVSTKSLTSSTYVSTPSLYSQYTLASAESLTEGTIMYFSKTITNGSITVTSSNGSHYAGVYVSNVDTNTVNLVSTGMFKVVNSSIDSTWIGMVIYAKFDEVGVTIDFVDSTDTLTPIDITNIIGYVITADAGVAYVCK